MLQRSYISAQHDNLYAENSLLRERVRKISQIQPYIELLLQNNKKYQDDIKDLQFQNNKLRGRIDGMLQQTLLLKEAHKNQISQVRGGFELDIEKLIRQLKDILRDKQAMQDANSSLIEELTNRSRKDIQTKKRQIEQLELDSVRKITKLNDTIKAKDKIIEQVTQELKYKESFLTQQIQQLNYKISLLVKDKEHLSNQIDILSQEKRNLIRKNKQLSKQNQETSIKWLRNDQQKSQNLLQMKNKNNDLIKKNDDYQQKIRVQQKIINEQGRKIGHLTKQCDEILNLKNQIQSSLRRTMRQLEDLKSQHAQIVEKLDNVSKTTQAQLKRQGEQLIKLSDENKKLTRQNIELSSSNKDKISQIQDLIRAIQKIQRKLGDINEKCVFLQQQNARKTTENKNLQQKLQHTLLEKKSLGQKLSLYSTHNATLQEMLQKQKRRNVNLETSRFQIQTIAMGALSKPQQICRQYERQIEKIIQQFLVQKQQIYQTHDKQILNLKSTYEQALKQKEEYFNKKIIFLQKQMSTLRSLR